MVCGKRQAEQDIRKGRKKKETALMRVREKQTPEEIVEKEETKQSLATPKQRSLASNLIIASRIIEEFRGSYTEVCFQEANFKPAARPAEASAKDIQRGGGK